MPFYAFLSLLYFFPERELTNWRQTNGQQMAEQFWTVLVLPNAHYGLDWVDEQSVEVVVKGSTKPKNEE